MCPERKHCTRIPTNTSLRLESYPRSTEIDDRRQWLNNNGRSIQFLATTVSYWWYGYMFETLIQRFERRYQQQPFERHWRCSSNPNECSSLENRRNASHNERPCHEWWSIFKQTNIDRHSLRGGQTSLTSFSSWSFRKVWEILFENESSEIRLSQETSLTIVGGNQQRRRLRLARDYKRPRRWSHGEDRLSAVSKHDVFYFVEMFTDDFPDSRPLKTNTTHVVIRDLHYFQQTEHPWRDQM